MKAFEAYDYVLNAYQIRAKEIAEATGKSESDISKFRNGHRNISADMLQLLVRALPVEARAHFNMLFSFQDADPEVHDKDANSEISYKDAPKKTLKVVEASGEYKV